MSGELISLRDRTARLLIAMGMLPLAIHERCATEMRPRAIGAGGFEPPNARSKIWWLATCRRPNRPAQDWTCQPTQNARADPEGMLEVSQWEFRFGRPRPPSVKQP
jgi:hypothetical protein